ncbi:MAG: hypothetical protein ACUVX8_02795 [Candidatus Zipacnadales bacterium]
MANSRLQRTTYQSISGGVPQGKGDNQMMQKWVIRSGVSLLVAIILLPGCGGGEGVPASMVGLYIGVMQGDGNGPLRFRIEADGTLVGNFRLPPICDGPISITGVVESDGRVTFQGRACGLRFTGTGQVTLEDDNEQFRGSGAWTTNTGASGTWSTTWSGQTGSITV